MKNMEVTCEFFLSVQNTQKWWERGGESMCVCCEWRKTAVDIKILKLIMESCRNISRHLVSGHQDWIFIYIRSM